LLYTKYHHLLFQYQQPLLEYQLGFYQVLVVQEVLHHIQVYFHQIK